MFIKTIKLFCISLLLSSSVNGQIIIDPTPTPINMVTNTLIGPGLATSNITFTGNVNQIGTFNAGSSNIGLPSGIVMSSVVMLTSIAQAGGNLIN